MAIEKTEFEMIKQIMLNQLNLVSILSEMNNSKFFPSSDVNKAIKKFWDSQDKFATQKETNGS